MERRRPSLAAPFAGKAGKKQYSGAAKSKKLRRPAPLWQRFLPLVISGASSKCIGFFFAHNTPRDDRVLFALFCLLGGVVAVEASRRAVVALGDALPAADAAIAHFRGDASGYLASWVIVVILQGVWSEQETEGRGAKRQPEDPFKRYRSALSCLAVFSVAASLQFVAPYLGGFLLRQLGDVRASCLLRSGDRRCARWKWKIAKQSFAICVVFGLCVTAVVLSGGGAVLLTLGMTHSVVSGIREAIPVIRKVWLKLRMSRGKCAAAVPSRPAQNFSLQGVITSVRSGPTKIVCSPVALPTLLLWMTYSTICSWPKECTDRLTLLLDVLATAICIMHLARSPVNETDPPLLIPGNNAERRGAIVTTWANRVLVCACCLAAWTLLMLCALIVFGRRESPEGILVMVLVVTAVALRTRHEESWRGLMLVFWVALLIVLVNADASKLMQQNKVLHRLFSDDRGGLPYYLGVYRAMAQLREEGRVAMWTACP